MASEEIIQRLLDEKKITVKEAMTLIIDTCKYLLLSENKQEETAKDYPIVQVMYGVRPVDYKQDSTQWSTDTYSSSDTYDAEKYDGVRVDIDKLAKTKTNE